MHVLKNMKDTGGEEGEDSDGEDGDDEETSGVFAAQNVRRLLALEEHLKATPGALGFDTKLAQFDALIVTLLAVMEREWPRMASCSNRCRTFARGLQRLTSLLCDVRAHKKDLEQHAGNLTDYTLEDDLAQALQEHGLLEELLALPRSQKSRQSEITRVATSELSKDAKVPLAPPVALGRTCADFRIRYP